MAEMRPIYGTGDNYGEILGYEEVPTAATSIASKINVAPATPFQGMSDNYQLDQDIVQKLDIGGIPVQAFYDSQTGNLTGYSADVNDTRITYSPTGEVRSAESLKGSFGDFLKEVAPIALTALTAGGAGSTIGGLLAPSASTATQAAIGGAVLGGGGAAATGNNVLSGALLGGLGGYYSGGGFNPADQGLNSQLTMAQIESGLGTPGYGYGAQAAASGLFDPALIGAGAYTQTSYPYDMAEFLAADTQNLYSQVGNNIPAIEQNLIASGVDPLVAADVTNTITLNPNISTYDLTNYINTSFGGGNLYDVNAATQYPTSVLPDEGGLLSDLPTETTPPKDTVVNPPTTTTPTPGTKVVDPDLAKIISSGVTKVLSGLLTAGAINQMTNKPSVGGLPTQGVPTNSPEYYQAIQQYYNTYMPEQPRDVATPLQQWYNSKYGA